MTIFPCCLNQVSDLQAKAITFQTALNTEAYQLNLLDKNTINLLKNPASNRRTLSHEPEKHTPQQLIDEARQISTLTKKYINPLQAALLKATNIKQQIPSSLLVRLDLSSSSTETIFQTLQPILSQTPRHKNTLLTPGEFGTISCEEKQIITHRPVSNKTHDEVTQKETIYQDIKPPDPKRPKQ